MSDDLIRSACEFIETVTERFYPLNNEPIGNSFHWEKLSFRVYPGEVSIWSGYNGHGKSIFTSQVCLDMTNFGDKGLIASFEMSGMKILYRMVRQVLGKANPSQLEIRNALEWLGKKIFIYDKTGTGSKDTLLRVFKRAFEKEGVNHFFIDSLMKCGLDPEDYKGQKNFVDSFQNFAQEHKVHVNIIAHSRKGATEEEKPGKFDIRGAGEISDLADNVFMIWRNKKKERLCQQWFDIRSLPSGQTIEKLEREYDCIIDCCKHREMGGEAEGQYGFYFHRPSFQFIDKFNQCPLTYYEG